MTTFTDGPAKGQTLMIKRAPRFLRVVETGGAGARTWDALDQVDDTARAEEKIYAYEICGEVGWCHLNRGRGRSGFYPIASYRLVPNQPPDATLRDNESWRRWAESHRVP